jgi:chromosome partitioning protein
VKITVASFKGGVGKTTTAVHIATYLSKLAPTILIDGDPNRSATGWAKRGELPFPIIDEKDTKRAGEFAHTVIDTEANPNDEDLVFLARNCDLLVLPTTPDALALDALGRTIERLKSIGKNNHVVLLTIVPPRPNRDGEEARLLLKQLKIPTFRAEIARLVAYTKASREGVPVYIVDDRRASVAWTDYVKLGKEILKRGKEK